MYLQPRQRARWTGADARQFTAAIEVFISTLSVVSCVLYYFYICIFVTKHFIMDVSMFTFWQFGMMMTAVFEMRMTMWVACNWMVFGLQPTNRPDTLSTPDPSWLIIYSRTKQVLENTFMKYNLLITQISTWTYLYELKFTHHPKNQFYGL